MWRFGSEPVEPRKEVNIDTSFGKARAEHVFMFRRIKWDVEAKADDSPAQPVRSQQIPLCHVLDLSVHLFAVFADTPGV